MCVVLCQFGYPSAAEASSSHLSSCPTCHTSMPVAVAEQLHHQNTCAISEAKSKNVLKHVFAHEAVYCTVCVVYVNSLGLQPSSPVEEPTTAAAAKEYFCQECRETFNLTSIDILKHKRKHKRSQT